MKTFQSKVTIESKLPDWQGVSFTVRRFSEGLRIAVNEKLGPQLEKMRDLIGEANAISPKVDETISEREVSRLNFLANAISMTRAEINRAYVEAGIVKIDGLEIDGVQATALSLIESGPRDLYEEVLTAALREAGMSEEERKNSESPTISDAAAVGRTSDMTAQIANVTDSTQLVTAESISQAT